MTTKYVFICDLCSKEGDPSCGVGMPHFWLAFCCVNRGETMHLCEHCKTDIKRELENQTNE